MKKDNIITSYGFFTTLVVTVVGIGIFSYPRDISDLVGTDEWIVTIVAGILYILIVKFILKSIEINNYKNITVIIQDNFGKFLGNIILVISSILNISTISIAMRAFVEVVKMYLLEKTPTEFLILIMILTGVYLVRGGVGNIIKFNEISFCLMFIPILIILAFTLKIADFTNLLPILRKEPMNYISAMKYTLFCFSGIEILYLIAPLLKEKKKSHKISLKAMAFITIFYAIITVLCIAVFKPTETGKLLWPTITLIRTLDIPGSIVERWDGIILSLWIVFYFGTFSNTFIFSSYLLSDGLALKDIKIATAVLVPFIYIIAMYPTNITEVYKIINIIIPVAVCFNILILPLLLIITGKIKHSIKGGRS